MSRITQHLLTNNIKISLNNSSGDSIPDQFIIVDGSWLTDNVMKTIYYGAINEELKKMNHKINEHSESMQHDMQHK